MPKMWGMIFGTPTPILFVMADGAARDRRKQEPKAAACLHFWLRFQRLKSPETH
jgi:hypothetical protein